MYFELCHSARENHYYYLNVTGLTFPTHLHLAFECLVQRRGATALTVDGKRYVLRQGDAALIFPLQQHSYEKIEDGLMDICIFSPDIVSSYSREVQNILPDENIFRFSMPTSEFSNRWLAKSFCYGVCGSFAEQQHEFHRRETRDDLLTSMLIFVEENLGGDCGLSRAAEAVGYDYTYISKLFKKRIGMTFNEYVNSRRIHESFHFLRSTDMGIGEIAETCGFGTFRTFNRQFILATGVTPSEYRKGRG